MLAVKLNHEKVVELLLQYGANPFLTDQLGLEALDYKVSTAHNDQRTYPVVQLITAAKEQWRNQTREEDIQAMQ